MRVASFSVIEHPFSAYRHCTPVSSLCAFTLLNCRAIEVLVESASEPPASCLVALCPIAVKEGESMSASMRCYTPTKNFPSELSFRHSLLPIQSRSVTHHPRMTKSNLGGGYITIHLRPLSRLLLSTQLPNTNRTYGAITREGSFSTIRALRIGEDLHCGELDGCSDFQ